MISLISISLSVFGLPSSSVALVNTLLFLGRLFSKQQRERTILVIFFTKVENYPEL